MDENKRKKDAPDAPPATDKARSWFKNLGAEFKKIIWPDKKTMWKHTVNVILVSALIGVIIFVMDLAFSTGHEALYNLFRGS